MKRKFLITLIALAAVICTVFALLSFTGCTKADGVKLKLKGSSYVVTGVSDDSITDLVIPSEHNGIRVTAISDEAFDSCESLETVTIPGSIKSIGEYSFSFCKNLTTVTILDGVSSIGMKAFLCCYKLKSLIIPDSVTYLDPWAFEECKGITDITAPAVAFSYSGSSARYKYIPSTVLQTVVITSGNAICEDAFKDCASLTSITIPDSVTTISSGAFSGCSSLVSISIPDGVASIGDSAFSGCSSLNYNVYENANYLGNDTSPYIYLAEYTDTNSTSCTINDETKFIGSYAFSGCSNLINVTIPDSVTTIGSGAFKGCKGITNITIPDGVTSIGGWTFSDCIELKSITIPNGVTSIGGWAFIACNRLKDVYYSGSEQEWEAISIGSSYNENLINANIHYNYNG